MGLVQQKNRFVTGACFCLSVNSTPKSQFYNKYFSATLLYEYRLWTNRSWFQLKMVCTKSFFFAHQ
jgi:hypothetical protein